MRLPFLLLFICTLAGGGWYAWENIEPIRTFIISHTPSHEFRTLEIRYSAEEIMQAHRPELLKNADYSFLEPKLMFYPYLLMQVKYADKKGETNEGNLLWGLNDGEIVIQTSNWERTHGFEDCLVAKADQHDFKILKALIEGGGLVEKEKLYGFFKNDSQIVDRWVESCQSKKLIVLTGNKFRLHLQDPKMKNEPITQFGQPLVTFSATFSNKVKGRYTVGQIQKMATNAFGNDFAIRKKESLFLPVYAISVQNPDGSILTTHWNALTGQEIHFNF